MQVIGNLDEFRCLAAAPMKGCDFFIQSATKFKCNFAVIGVVHSWIEMIGNYFNECG